MLPSQGLSKVPALLPSGSGLPGKSPSGGLRKLTDGRKIRLKDQQEDWVITISYRHTTPPSGATLASWVNQSFSLPVSSSGKWKGLIIFAVPSSSLR